MTMETGQQCWLPRYHRLVTIAALDDLCRQHRVLALYLFGSRADDGRRRLGGEPVTGIGSDLDVGIVLESFPVHHRRLAALQVALEEMFAPLRVDLVPLQRVDALLQFAAVDGHRVAATDTTRADLFELEVMRRAAELLPLQRQRERDVFGLTSR
jgi:predicted nucleotidyltransferase